MSTTRQTTRHGSADATVTTPTTTTAEFSVNIDGTPMLGDTDIHGNAFGVTGSTFDEW